MSIVNPNNCCGVETDCCGAPLRTILTATLWTDAGPATTRMAFDGEESSFRRWKGEIEFAAQNGQPDAAPRLLEIALSCQEGAWSLDLGPLHSGRPWSVNCEPLFVEFMEARSDQELPGPLAVFVTD